MALILLGFMGNSKDYQALPYDNPIEYEHRYSTAAIYEAYQRKGINIDKIISLRTEEAKHNSLKLYYNIKLLKDCDENIENKMANYKETNPTRYDIKDSFFETMAVSGIENESELDSTFKNIDYRICELLAEYKKIELVLDITYGFRTQPIALMMIANLIKEKYENVVIENVWYCIKPEGNRLNGKLLSIKRHNELADWSLGLSNYMKTGETEILKQLTYHNRSSDEAKNLVEKLDLFSKCLKVCRMDAIKKVSEEVKEAIILFEQSNNNTELNLLKSMFLKMSQKFISFKEEIWRPSIEWNLQNGNIQQALTICSEYFPIILFQYSVIIKTSYNINKPEEFKVTKVDKSNFSNLKQFIDTTNMDRYELIVDADKRCAYLKYTKASFDLLFYYIQKDVNEIVNKTKVRGEYNSELIQNFFSIIFPDQIKNNANRFHLNDLWDKIKDEFSEAILYDKKGKFLLTRERFNYIYAFYVLDEIIYHEESIVKELKVLHGLLFQDNKLSNCKEIHRVLKVINNYYNPRRKILNNENTNRVLEDYINIHSERIEIISKYASVLDNQIYSNYSLFFLNESDKKSNYNLVFECKNKFKSKKNQICCCELSDYLLTSDTNVNELKKAMDAYSILRIYRNDINHAGTVFSKDLIDLKQDIHDVSEFYEDKGKSNIKQCIKTVADYIGIIELNNKEKREMK